MDNSNQTKVDIENALAEFIKLKTNNICSLTVLGSALKSFLLSSKSIFADSFIQFFIDMIYTYNFYSKLTID